MMSMKVNMMKSIMMKKMIWKIRIFWSRRLGMRSIMILIENSFQSQHRNNSMLKTNKIMRAK